MTSSDELYKRLGAPFSYQDIDWRVQNTNDDNTKGRAVPYLRFQAIADRLDTIVGANNWENEYTPGPCGGVVCRLSLRIDNEWIRKSNGADNTSFEPVKGGLTDAFKRAAVMWNIGRYLYNCPSVEVDIDPETRLMLSWPKLPREMLPENEQAEHGYDVANGYPVDAASESSQSSGRSQDSSQDSTAPAQPQAEQAVETQKDTAVVTPAVNKEAGQQGSSDTASSASTASAAPSGEPSEKDGFTLEDAMDSVPDGLDEAHVKRIRTILERSWDKADIRPNMRTYVNDREKSKMPDQAIFYVMEILTRLDELDNRAAAV